MVVIPTTTNVTCNGACNGTFNAIVTGGTPAYMYSPALPWSGLCAGNYSISVTDSKGCQATSSVTITQPPVLSAVTSITNTSCGSCTDGAASVSSGGGTPAYTYQWMPGGLTTPTISNLPIGCYTVVVTDSKSCQTTTVTCVSLSTTTSIDALNLANNITLAPNPSNGVFTITLNNTTDVIEAFVTNALGQVVKTEATKNVSQLNIDLSGMSKGIYYLTITTHDRKNMMKLILN